MTRIESLSGITILVSDARRVAISVCGWTLDDSGVASIQLALRLLSSPHEPVASPGSIWIEELSFPTWARE
jgi:hypothetical protein